MAPAVHRAPLRSLLAYALFVVSGQLLNQLIRPSSRGKGKTLILHLGLRSHSLIPCVQDRVRSYMQSLSPMRWFVISLPVLVVAHELLSFLVPEILRLLLPYPLKVILGLH